MMKDDKQMLDMLRSEFEKSSESVKIPLRLQKDSVVAMLKNEGNKEDGEKDFSVKTGTNQSKLLSMRKYIAAAAMFALILVGAVSVIRESMPSPAKVIREDTFYSGYEGAELIKTAESFEEIEVVVKDIFNGKKDESQKPQSGVSQAVSGETQTLISGEEIIDKLYQGYQSVVTANKSLGEISGNFYSVNSMQVNTDVISAQSDVEADIVKSNGEYLYIVTTGKNVETGNMTEQIKIVKSSPAEEMKTVSSVTLSDNVVAGAFEECIEIYLKDNILIAILGRKDFRTETETTAVYYDITNPESPEKIRQHTQDGKYLFSSLKGNNLCLVTDKQVMADDSDIVPSFDVDGATTNLSAEEVFISVKDPEASYIFITVTDVSDFGNSVGRFAILGSGKQLRYSENAITVAREFVTVEENGEPNGSLTEICRFNVDGSSVSFAGTYVVKGSLIGGVSVNDKNGNMIVATAVENSSNIYVLGANMEFVGGLEEVFPEKKVDAIRFIGEKGYLTSGEETMIVNLSSSGIPEVAGTIPSKLFAGSLYEISESLLLGITADSEGMATFRLFDVSNPENPSVVSEYTTEKNCRTLSSADSRGIMTVPEKGIFGVPVVVSDEEKGTEVSAYMLFDVSEGKINPVGLCRHDESYVGDAAVRADYNNGTVYTVSGRKVAAFSVDDCKIISQCEIR